MAEKVTLEQVRDWHRKMEVMLAKAAPLSAGAARHKAAADAIDAHIAQPAQAVDVGVIRDVIAQLGEQPFIDMDIDRRMVLADKLTRAIGDAQAEGWSVPEGWEIDVGEKSAAIHHRTGSKLVIKPERGNALLFDLLHQLAKSLPTPPTKAPQCP